MNHKEAMRRIKEHNEIHSKREPFAVHITEALNMAIFALTKQIAEKPLWDDIDKMFLCPQCDEMVSREYNLLPTKFCPTCGQALDWSEEK